MISLIRSNISKARRVPAYRVFKEPAQSLDLERFHQNGYALVDAVFTHDEFTDLKRDFLRSYELGYEKQDLFSNPLINRVLYNKKIIEIANEVLGGRPTYYGDGSISKRPAGTNLHRDNIDRLDPDGPDWSDDYKIIKCAVYLQD